MIREILEFILTPASKEARRLGYLYETVALNQRYRRRKRDWQKHISECHAAILGAVKAVRPGKTLLVLGSGPLVEVPMDELLKHFSKVVLVDLVHPREVRKRWGRHPRVTMVEEDLLGIGKTLLEWKKGDPLPPPRALSLPAFAADFILSANCLSQLALKPRQRLAGSAPDETLDDYCESLSVAHLESIREARRQHLIIADFESRVVDGEGKVTEISQPYFEVAQLKRLKDWVWRLAPPGEVYPDRAVEMSVGAFQLGDS